jgi:hypothetical protein
MGEYHTKCRLDRSCVYIYYRRENKENFSEFLKIPLNDDFSARHLNPTRNNKYPSQVDIVLKLPAGRDPGEQSVYPATPTPVSDHVGLVQSSVLRHRQTLVHRTG